MPTPYFKLITSETRQIKWGMMWRMCEVSSGRVMACIVDKGWNTPTDSTPRRYNSVLMANRRAITRSSPAINCSDNQARQHTRGANLTKLLHFLADAYDALCFYQSTFWDMEESLFMEKVLLPTLYKDTAALLTIFVDTGTIFRIYPVHIKYGNHRRILSTSLLKSYWNNL